MRHFRDTLTLPSRLAYLCWRVLRLKRPLEVRMKRGERILMRQVPAEDYGAAREVFVDQNYDDPRKTGGPIRRVVDLGANIGCSCLYWVREYPGCTIEAFEPHPVHLSLLRENLRRNLLSDRVHVHPVAVGAHRASAFLTDQGLSSHVADNPQPEASHPVQMVDFYAVIGADSIDLLKIDIEGSEYQLMSDPRFLSLDAQTVVLEWHATAEYPGETGGTWCRARLEDAGYQVGEQVQGLLWGWRVRAVLERWIVAPPPRRQPSMGSSSC